MYGRHGRLLLGFFDSLGRGNAAIHHLTCVQIQHKGPVVVIMGPLAVIKKMVIFLG